MFDASFDGIEASTQNAQLLRDIKGLMLQPLSHFSIYKMPYVNAIRDFAYKFMDWYYFPKISIVGIQNVISNVY